MAFSKTVASAPKRLDLVFAMDCTGSMESYIQHAQQNIFEIADTINRIEKVDLRLALVEYRDHPPQESTFVTRVLDFTEHLKVMKAQLDQCTAEGGGDLPEAVADALHAVLKLSWRSTSVKICVFVADAPPHGLGCFETAASVQDDDEESDETMIDGFPDGCPEGHDPMVTARQMAEESIMVYTVGCEPSISPFKDWFMAISHITSGQYVPLASANLLSRVIVAATSEELSLSDLTPQIASLVLSSGTRLNKEALVEKVMESLKGTKTKLLASNKGALQKPTEHALKLAEQHSMAEVRLVFELSSVDEAESSVESTAEDYVIVDSDLTREQATRLVAQTLASSSKLGPAFATSPHAKFEKL